MTTQASPASLPTLPMRYEYKPVTKALPSDSIFESYTRTETTSVPDPSVLAGFTPRGSEMTWVPAPPPAEAEAQAKLRSVKLRNGTVVTWGNGQTKVQGKGFEFSLNCDSEWSGSSLTLRDGSGNERIGPKGEISFIFLGRPVGAKRDETAGWRGDQWPTVSLQVTPDGRVKEATLQHARSDAFPVDAQMLTDGAVFLGSVPCTVRPFLTQAELR